MSKKINISAILSGHLDTLKEADSQNRSWCDLSVFFGIPLLIALFFFLVGGKLEKEICGLLINFGAIFTALLLSVLILVYDQASKVRCSSDESALKSLKIKLLNELYYNICYSVLTSIALVVVCLINTIVLDVEDIFVVKGWEIEVKYAKYITSPLAVFLISNLVLTIVMIVKRMHAILTTDS